MTEKKYTILLVDDNIKAREALEGFLSVRLSSAELFTARDGIEALKHLKEQRIDLVITDEVMPKKSGMTLIKEAIASGVSCPFIVLTGLRAGDIQVPRQDAKRIRVIEKPVKFIDLQQVIEELLSLSLEKSA